MTNEAQPDYLAYLLRLWRVNAAAGAWRASLEDPHTGEQHVFAGLEALFSFLEEETGGCGRGAPSRAKPEPPEEI
jgi:hypothetical protein